MRKIFYITRNHAASDGSAALPPDMDRFSRIAKLNALLECGWSIKEYKNEDNGEFFILERS
ncbi:MAG: hypothetical protein IKO44_01090 [Ruminococcus sp.]|nr:hypothetical protein [Ruminococcus sp.]